jgi:hypothetical protein
MALQTWGEGLWRREEARVELEVNAVAREVRAMTSMVINQGGQGEVFSKLSIFSGTRNAG